jgi:hypothetical protein
MTERELTGGRMAWAEALSLLNEATCLWQNIDGLHVASPPSDPPLTSILWGWGPGDRLVRVRLDGATAHVAVLERPPAAVPTVPWSPDDGRVKSHDRQSIPSNGLGTPYEMVVFGAADIPITFLRPAPVKAP